MKTITLPASGKEVRVPSTGEDWQLYSTSMACGTAARSLTAALVRVLKVLDRHATNGYIPTDEGARKLYDEHLRPVMGKYSAYGACDTEPRGVAYGTMEKTVRTLTGRSVYFY